MALSYLWNVEAQITDKSSKSPDRQSTETVLQFQISTYIVFVIAVLDKVK